MKSTKNDRLLRECAMDEQCAYLFEHKQSTHYKIISDCSVENCERHIRQGWRRFGNMFFRPICAECSACESVRIDVGAYEFSRSERRVMRKNEDLQIVIRRPTMTQRHLELFILYHHHMHERRGWEEQTVTPGNYYTSFVQGHNDFGYEVLFFEGRNLLAVDLIDVLPQGISSIYFYYDPEHAKRSLGRFSMLHQIRLAKEYNLPWIYLGYYVQGCPSLEYKREYAPLQQLQGRPAETDEPIWLPLHD